MGAVKLIAVLLLCIPVAFLFRMMISNLHGNLKEQNIAEEKKKRGSYQGGSRKTGNSRGKVIKYEELESERRRKYNINYGGSENYRRSDSVRNRSDRGRNRK